MPTLLELRDHPMGAYILMTYALGFLAMLLAIWVPSYIARKDAARADMLKAALAAAELVRGKISRFGTSGSDEYSVDYMFALEGDPTVYHTRSDFLSGASYGSMTKPGDIVTFKLLEGRKYAREFYNASAAKT